MTDRGIEAVRRHLAKLPPQENMTFDELRAQYDRAERAFPIRPEVAVEHISAGAAPAERLRPVGAGAAVVLYLHGGGYVIGSPRSHRHLAAAIATSSGASAVLLDYRRAPEHPFPAAVDDAVAAYRWLLEVARVDPKSIAIAGDSAGGGLTVALLLALRDGGAPLPAAGICISPWVDLTCSLGSYVTKAAVDPVVQPPLVAVMAKAYLGGEDPRTPLASPLHADLRGLPPLLIQVGSEEVLLDDARELAARAQGAGVDVTLEVWDRMIHVWHWFLPMLDEAPAAIDRIGVFVSARVGAS
jgi:phosphinothricin tripeptide acetyl hydrolase